MDNKSFQFYEGLDWLEAYNNIKPLEKTYDYVVMSGKEYPIYKQGAYQYILMPPNNSVVSLKSLYNRKNPVISYIQNSIIT